jgi:hypothetical protein
MSKSQDSHLCPVCGVSGEHDCRLESGTATVGEIFSNHSPRDEKKVS